MQSEKNYVKNALSVIALSTYLAFAGCGGGGGGGSSGGTTTGTGTGGTGGGTTPTRISSAYIVDTDNIDTNSNLTGKANCDNPSGNIYCWFTKNGTPSTSPAQKVCNSEWKLQLDENYLGENAENNIGFACSTTNDVNNAAASSSAYTIEPSQNAREQTVLEYLNGKGWDLQVDDMEIVDLVDGYKLFISKEANIKPLYSPTRDVYIIASETEMDEISGGETEINGESPVKVFQVKDFIEVTLGDVLGMPTYVVIYTPSNTSTGIKSATDSALSAEGL